MQNKLKEQNTRPQRYVVVWQLVFTTFCYKMNKYNSGLEQYTLNTVLLLIRVKVTVYSV